MNRGLFKFVVGAAASLAVATAFAQGHDTTKSTNNGGSGNTAQSGRPNGGGTHTGGPIEGRGSYGSTNRSYGSNYGANYGSSQRSYGSSSSRGNYGTENSRNNGAANRSQQDRSSTRFGNGNSSRYSHSSNTIEYGQNRTDTRGGGSQVGGLQNRGDNTVVREHTYSSINRFEGGQGSENLRHLGSSRSGTVSYSGSNNVNNGGRVNVGPIQIGVAPHGRIGNGHLDGKLFGREGVGLVHDGYRCNYFSYWPGWRDGFFAYPFYIFDPYAGPCYCSPWYYYPCLPAYVAAPRVIIVDSYPSTNWSGNDYDWQPAESNAAKTSSDLDYSIDDIVDAFQKDDHKAIDRLVPQSGNVNIYVDGKYSYSLAAGDFYDTYVDGIESTKTDHYEVMDVKANADGTARVTAKHIYTDPWGKRTFVYHSYFLVHEGTEYVIREFGTSNYRAD